MDLELLLRRATLSRRLNREAGGVSIFTFVPPGPRMSFQEMWAKEGFTGGTVGSGDLR